MRILFPLAAIGLIGTAVIAASPARIEREAKESARLEKALAGKVAGKPRSCITLSQNRSSEILGENAILYRFSKQMFFINKPVGGCPGLRTGQTLVTRIPSDQLCSGDITRVVDLVSGFEGGACTLGEFVPYSKSPS